MRRKQIEIVFTIQILRAQHKSYVISQTGQRLISIYIKLSNQVIQIFSIMGCQYSEATVPKSPIDSILQKNYLTVASLNYCGIMNSPFEFYCQEFQTQLRELSEIFISLIPKYFPTFVATNKEWQFGFGKLDVKFRVGRYSPMFSLNVGIQNGKFLSRQQFQKKWVEVFVPEIQKIKKNNIEQVLKFTKQQQNAMMIYDVLTYHTMLRFVFKIDSIDEAVGKDPQRYRQKMGPFYNLSFLNEDKKLKKTITNFSKLEADIFFFQEYSEYFHDYLVNRKEHYISYDKTKDTMIVVKQSSFKQRKNIDIVLAKLPQELRKNLDWAERSSYMCVDNYILIGAHLSSKELKSKEQIQIMKKALVEVKKILPEYNIIVGGDLNSFLAKEQPFSKQFNMYPDSIQQLTTIKKRTMTQGQYKKGDKSVKQSKDKIITNLKIMSGQIMYISGKIPIKDSFVPSDEHPFDHFVVVTKIERKD